MKIVATINEAKFYSLIIDETQDISKLEQVSKCVRYVNDELEVFESFIGFWDTLSQTGEQLFLLIQRILQELRIPIENLVGKCYDGGSNMSGIYNGLSARLKFCSKAAVYVHCYAHRLNLSLEKACSQITQVRNALGTVNALHNFIEASAKRHAIFQSVQNESDRKTLKLLSDTRWASRHHAIVAIQSKFLDLLKCLEVI